MIAELVRIPTAPVRCSELVQVVQAARSGYLAPPRCLSARMLVAEDESSVVVLLDWSSREAHDEAAASPEGGTFFAAVQALAAGPPDLGWYVGV